MKKLTEGVKETVEMMETLNLALVDIWEQVAIYIREKYGDEKFDEKFRNFDKSWEKLHEKYGNDLVIALGEQTDEVNFINHEGYLDKEVVAQLVKDIKRRRARLSEILASRDAS
ncbi:hypothetical protein A2572_01110 [Candidatus Collierbacteria bacterium RIFOXYD1_FULL_40_9]|uniref:Uncharacterized protein n=1 Tax=Candidatus Collierbacteria bacterium RIFOXYD1_FULL_40_9 TaxID=1817731 RepID=A0A1F5FP36_9BACT|nr:MAG: hypothetical protein A2572_01110 [Candidatus Collierbacteria bacterium RIFOXYD1_FULL_40_9]